VNIKLVHVYTEELLASTFPVISPALC